MNLILIILIIFVVTFSIFGVVDMIRQTNKSTHKDNLDYSKPMLTYYEWHKNRDRMAEQFAKDNQKQKAVHKKKKNKQDENI